jgi:anti-sigma factor RsiW
MNWYRHPELVDQLASSYVLGTLQGGARRRFESVMAGDAAMRQAVQDWTDRLSPLLTTLPPVEPSPDLWAAIEARTGTAPPAPLPWWKRWLAPLPVGALAMGLFIGVSRPSSGAPRPRRSAPRSCPRAMSACWPMRRASRA